MVLLQRALEGDEAGQAVELYQSVRAQARTTAPSTSQRRWLTALEADGRLARWREADADPPTPGSGSPARAAPGVSAVPGPLRQPSGCPGTATAAPEPGLSASVPQTSPAQITAAAAQVRTALVTAAAAGTTITWTTLLRRAPALAHLVVPDREHALRAACIPEQDGEPLLAAVLTSPLRAMHPAFPVLWEEITGRTAVEDCLVAWAYEVLRVQQHWRHRRR